MKQLSIKSIFRKFLEFILIIAFTNIAYADPITFDFGEGNISAKIIQLVALITVLSLAPSILVMVTSFTRIIVVLSFLRNALGLQQSPPNSVMISLALFLTAFIMGPVFETSYSQGILPLMEEKIDEKAAFGKIVKPFQEFMLKNTREKDLELFVNIAQRDKKTKIEKPEDTPLHIIVPAFMISELRRSFEIGFLIFIPFLIIDMLVSSILMAMGMMMLPPVMISLPFKLIFFVIIDGWHMICGSLVRSFGV